MLRKTVLAAALLAASCGGGCVQLGFALFGVGSSESRRYPGKTDSEIWEALQETVDGQYYIKLADDREKYLESEWNEHLGPMYRSGKRFRVRAWVRHDDETKAPFVAVTVDREVNDNMDHPLSSQEAEWELDTDNDGRDASREHRLLTLMHFRLTGDIKPSDKALKGNPSEYSLTPQEEKDRKLWGTPKKDDSGGKDEDLWKD